MNNINPVGTIQTREGKVIELKPNTVECLKTAVINDTVDKTSYRNSVVVMQDGNVFPLRLLFKSFEERSLDVPIKYINYTDLQVKYPRSAVKMLLGIE